MMIETSDATDAIATATAIVSATSLTNDCKFPHLGFHQLGDY
jgi:hypothetical protein